MGSVLLEPPAAAPFCTLPRRGAVFISVSPGVAGLLTPMLNEAGMEIADVTEAAAVPDESVVIVEADRGARLVQMLQDVRRRAGNDSFLIGITGWWSDCEPELRSVADALLHAPLRDKEFRALLQALPDMKIAPSPAAAGIR